MDERFGDLLEGLQGEAREARLRLLRDLTDAGCPLAELREAVAEDRLALLPVERELRRKGRYTEGEVAERAGIDVDALRRSRAALGLPIGPDDAGLDDLDVEVARALEAVLRAGVPLEGVLALDRVIGRAMLQVAATARSLFAEATVKPGATEHDVGIAAAAAARELVPQMAPTLAYAFEGHLRQLLRSDVLAATDIASGRTKGAREMAVGFADLVGFTRLGEQIPAEELGDVVARLEEVAAGRVEQPVTLVKTLGDAVMLVSPKPDPLIATALDLVREADAQGDDLPQLRVGLAYGPALERAGDWYGSPVNTASRVTTVARPGSVLATEAVKDAAEEGWRWSFAGQRRLKGVGPVKLFRARPGGPDR